MKQAERMPSGGDSRAIGVFDSGLGGLTVVAGMQALLPNENIVYLGDNARVPYGTRSAGTVRTYARNCASFLMTKDLKMLVIACNTVSAVAVDLLQQMYDIPVLGVIEAGAISAAKATINGRIGVIGTTGTIASNSYPRELQKMDAALEVFQNPAPLLVPLVEEGWVEGAVPELAVERYLQPLVAQDVDVLLLGCTHYPVLAHTIQQRLQALGSYARVQDSARAMAKRVRGVLDDDGLRNRQLEMGYLNCYVTDLPDSFRHVANRFLGHALQNTIEKIDI